MTLNCNSVYASVAGNLSYIADKEKIVPTEDLLNCVRYIQSNHAGPIFAKAYGCSSNARLAAEQFEMDRQKYWAKKNGKGLSGKSENKKEVLCHHFYASAHKEDHVTPELLQKILEKLIKRCQLENFRIFSSVHNNTDELHIHFSINAYNQSGNKKLHMNRATMNRMKIQLNYICAEYGISIIDDKGLRKWAWKHDKQYLRWLNDTKRGGKIKVRENISAAERQALRDEMKEERERKKQPEKTAEQEIQDVIENSYGTVKRGYEYRSYNLYPTIRKKKKYYRCRLWDDYGRKRSTLEMLFLLTAALLTDGSNFAEETNRSYVKAKPAKEIQKMIDGMKIAKLYCISDVEDLNRKKKEIGGDISSLKRAIYYLEKEMKTNDSEDLSERKEELEDRLWFEKKHYAAIMRVGDLMKETLREQYKYEAYEMVGFDANEFFEEKMRKPEAAKEEPKAAEPKKKMSLTDMIAGAEKEKGEQPRQPVRPKIIRKNRER